jgi:hypothetical protein
MRLEGRQEQQKELQKAKQNILQLQLLSRSCAPATEGLFAFQVSPSVFPFVALVVPHFLHCQDMQLHRPLSLAGLKAWACNMQHATCNQVLQHALATCYYRNMQPGPATLH